MILLKFVLLITYPLGIFCQFNMTAYREMPPLYDFDNYDECLERSEPSTYCMIIGEIVPNKTSALWNYIETVSAVSKCNYRHDVPFFGVCLNTCNELVDPLSPSRKDQLYTGNIKNTELIEYFTDINRKDADVRTLNHKVINICINYKFQQKYDLPVRSFIEYCVSNEAPPKFDFLEIIFIVLIATLLLVVALSTNYHRMLKNKQPLDKRGNDFYKQKLHALQDTLLTSFSLYRNYYVLTTVPTDKLSRDIRYFECYRFFGTLLVIFAHVGLLYKGFPISNTEFIEKLYYRVDWNLVLNGTVIIQMFFVMSSFLLTISFQRTLALKKPGIFDWFKMLFYRYLRLFPSLAFMILLNASILPRLQDGPFWRHTIQGENVFCRETWWNNLLFINNFTIRKSCLHQTWYLAADFQLYAIFVAVLIFIARFPKTRNFILGAWAAISFISTGMVTYFHKLDGVHQDVPESYRYLFWVNSDTFFKGYVPFYTNFGGFTFGTIAAFIYMKYKNEDLNLKLNKSKLNKLLILMIPTAVLILLSGVIFIKFDIVKPSVWVGIYGALHRNIWALMCGTIVLMMAFKVGFILYKFSALKVFIPLGRLSFQTYLIHTIVIRCLLGYVRQPEYANLLKLNTYILASIVITIFLAFILYMCLESPLTILTHLALKQMGLKSNTKSSQANGKTKDVTPATA